MSGDALLIAAFSGRALAQSARRAGFEPLVVDCFGDLDTAEAAAAWRCLPARVQVGFTRRPLVAALEALAGSAPKAPIGLVLGAGFECNPKLVARLAQHFPLIGNGAEAIGAAKDPATLFPLLDRLGIRHPETRLDPPPDPEGWLMKRIGGSGGLHIVPCPAAPRPDPRRYFQRRAEGAEVSVGGVVARRGSAFAISRQWTSPLAKRPYRYGGATGAIAVDADLEARLIDIAATLSRALDLVGLVSFDFLVLADGEPHLLDVNPRPGATLDVFDDAGGSLFQAHVAAWRGGDPASLLKDRWRPPAARAAALLYADHGAITMKPFDWPQWVLDRARPGTAIGRRQPVATVVAEADDPATAETICRNRLGLLENMLYEVKKGDHGGQE